MYLRHFIVGIYKLYALYLLYPITSNLICKMLPNILLLSVYTIVTQETFLTIGFKSTLRVYRARVCPHVVISINFGKGPCSKTYLLLVS